MGLAFAFYLVAQNRWSWHMVWAGRRELMEVRGQGRAGSLGRLVGSAGGRRRKPELCVCVCRVVGGLGGWGGV